MYLLVITLKLSKLAGLAKDKPLKLTILTRYEDESTKKEETKLASPMKCKRVLLLNVLSKVSKAEFEDNSLITVVCKDIPIPQKG